MNEGYDRDQKEFNNAIGFIQRLDKIFYMIANSKIENDTGIYLNNLKLLFHELSNDMNAEEVNKFKNKIRSLKKEIDGLKANNLRFIPDEILEDIEDLELDLRKVYDSAGLQNRKKENFFDSDEEW